MFSRSVPELNNSQKELQRLVFARTKPGADKEKIDAQIWDKFGEEWCVMFTDLSGFSRGTEKFGIIHFLQVILESQRIMFPLIEDHNGIVIKTEGDSLLVIFNRPDEALVFCKKVHEVLHKYNETMSDEEKILLCIGLGYGKILNLGYDDVFGAEVNAASKLGEDTAVAWEVLVTDSFVEAVKDSKAAKDFRFEKIDFIPPGAKAAYKAVLITD